MSRLEKESENSELGLTQYMAIFSSLSEEAYTKNREILRTSYTDKHKAIIEELEDEFLSRRTTNFKILLMLAQLKKYNLHRVIDIPPLSTQLTKKGILEKIEAFFNNDVFQSSLLYLSGYNLTTKSYTSDQPCFFLSLMTEESISFEELSNLWYSRKNSHKSKLLLIVLDINSAELWIKSLNSILKSNRKYEDTIIIQAGSQINTNPSYSKNNQSLLLTSLYSWNSNGLEFPGLKETEENTRVMPCLSGKNNSETNNEHSRNAAMKYFDIHLFQESYRENPFLNKHTSGKSTSIISFSLLVCLLLLYEYLKLSSNVTYSYNERVGRIPNGTGVYYYENGDRYEGTWVNHKRIGMGKLYHRNKLYYDGNWLHNFKHGYGTQYYQNGLEKYNGQWELDKYHGTGTLTFINGDFYKGEFKNGVFDGRGHLYFKNTIREYNGTFSNGSREGFGKFIGLDLTEYEGEWKNNLKHGKGKMYFKRENEQYEGDFFEDYRSGNGIYYYNSGGYYEGNWIKGQQDGFGIEYYPGGLTKYEGEWLHGKRHGNGTYFYSDDEVYIGMWENDFKHGNGTYYYPNKDVYTGEFDKDIKKGHGKYQLNNGEVYIGGWENDNFHGYGVHEYGDNEVYKGYFFNDMRHGNGTFIYKNGEKYVGDFDKNHCSGNGTYFYKSGALKYQGEWKLGKYHGSGSLFDESGTLVYKAQWENGNLVTKTDETNQNNSSPLS